MCMEVLHHRFNAVKAVMLDYKAPRRWFRINVSRTLDLREFKSCKHQASLNSEPNQLVTRRKASCDGRWQQSCTDSGENPTWWSFDRY